MAPRGGLRRRRDNPDPPSELEAPAAPTVVVAPPSDSPAVQPAVQPAVTPALQPSQHISGTVHSATEETQVTLHA
ncbi:hypothetical protein H0H92_013009, partial [Tricholoma furcatifolium]